MGRWFYNDESLLNNRGVAPMLPPSPAATAGAMLPPLAWQDVDLRRGCGGVASVIVSARQGMRLRRIPTICIVEIGPRRRDLQWTRTQNRHRRVPLRVAVQWAAQTRALPLPTWAALSWPGLVLGLHPRRLKLRYRRLGQCPYGSGCALADLSCAFMAAVCAVRARGSGFETQQSNRRSSGSGGGSGSGGIAAAAAVIL